MASGVNLSVINPNGQGGSLSDAFIFTGGIAPPPPTAALSITAVEPEVGLAAGGMPVLVRGTGFTAGVTVTFDTTAGTNVEIIDSTHLVVTTPAHAVGMVNVTVTDTAGETNTLTNGYGYITITPDHRSPGTTAPSGGQPPAPLPTGGRKGPGAPNTPGTAGIAGGSVTPPAPSPRIAELRQCEQRTGPCHESRVPFFPCLGAMIVAIYAALPGERRDSSTPVAPTLSSIPFSSISAPVSVFPESVLPKFAPGAPTAGFRGADISRVACAPTCWPPFMPPESEPRSGIVMLASSPLPIRPSPVRPMPALRSASRK